MGVKVFLSWLFQLSKNKEKALLLLINVSKSKTLQNVKNKTLHNTKIEAHKDWLQRIWCWVTRNHGHEWYHELNMISFL